MATVSKRKVHYPDSDGKPVGETSVHVSNLLWSFGSLRDHFAANPKMYVAADMFVYYEEGNPRKHVSPDLFAVRGIKPKTDLERRLYLVWEEGKSPEMVIEVTSKSTYAVDMRKKMSIYRDVLGVLEYFLFDPYGEYLEPRLQGYRLREGVYKSIRPVKERLPSQVLGLHLEAVEEMLRFFVPKTQQRLPLPIEHASALRQAEAERREAEAAQQRAEAERREAEAAQQRAEAERREAEAAQQRAEAERREAEAAQQRAEAGRRETEAAQQRAEAEAERLRREVEELRRKLSGP